MYRNIQIKLDKWIAKARRKPLIIRGARQVGKSTLVEIFGEYQPQGVVTVNLERYPLLEKVFKSANPRAIIDEIESLGPNMVLSDKTILFLDEIQAIPHALPSLRYFYEEHPEIPVIAAGSLLEFALDRNDFSMPVGRIEYLHMGPMTFSEFILALEEDKLRSILDNYEIGDEIGDIAHNRLLELQRLFLFIGGMPEAINAYTNKHRISDVGEVHRSIIETYREDFPKYGTLRDHDRMLHVLNNSARNVGRKVKYSQIDPNNQSSTLKKDLNLLSMARVITKVVHSSCNGVPLMAEANEKKYKLLFLDVGLANAICGLSWNHFSNLSETSLVNEGAIAEQFIGQHLLEYQSDQTNRNLTYWLREGKSGNAEVDFVLSFGGKIIPIEVKAGLSGSLRSLHQYMGEKEADIAIRFDTNKPSHQVIDAQFPKGNELKPVRYELYSFPLYLVERVCKIFSERG